MDVKSAILLQKILKDNGYSLTLPRKIVAELLWDNEPQTMRDLVRQSKRDIDRSSLYRTVALFEKLGIVQRIYIGWKYKVELSDVLTHHHHHASCLKCGKIVAVTGEREIEKLIKDLAAKHNFTPQNHQLEIRGLCSSCGQTS